MRDAEMICVALLSDVSSSSGEKRDDKDKADAKGGIGPSLGQMIVLFELMNKLRMVRRLKDSTAMSSGRRGSVNAIAVILVSLGIGMMLFGFLVIDGGDGDTDEYMLSRGI